MKSKFIFLFIVFFGFLNSNSQPFRVLTYNIRYDNPADGINNWENRKDSLIGQIKKFDPDIFGIQEGLNHQVEYLKSKFADFSFYGIGRDDGKTKGEYAGIFYKNERYTLLKSGSFWLSKTPSTPGIGWDAACIRICSYVYLLDSKTKQNIWVFNTHFDHVGKIAQLESSKLILNKIKELNVKNEAIILLGDFNMSVTSEAIKLISNTLQNTRTSTSNILCNTKFSYNGFGTTNEETQIDFIFVSKTKIKTNLFLMSNEQISETRYFSDHFPVLVDLEFISALKK